MCVGVLPQLWEYSELGVTGQDRLLTGRRKFGGVSAFAATKLVIPAETVDIFFKIAAVSVAVRHTAALGWITIGSIWILAVTFAVNLAAGGWRLLAAQLPPSPSLGRPTHAAENFAG